MIHSPLPRLYAILDTGLLEARGMALVDAARVMIDGGVRLLQLRHKGHFTRSLYAESQAIASCCGEAGARFVINDRADVARLLNAGLHLGQDDLAPEDARRVIGPEALLGYSTHNEHQLMRAASEPVDYLAIGPIFTTSSKQNPDPALGAGRIAGMRAITSKPLVAIGGITRSNAVQVLSSGADSVAVISDLVPAGGGLPALQARIQEWNALVKDMV